jgi:two-component system, OmpR family, sensor histidine kinase TctE
LERCAAWDTRWKKHERNFSAMKLSDLPPAIQDLISTHESEVKPLGTIPKGLKNRQKDGQSAGNKAPPLINEERSLFGEILDWMFAPLLLIWPLSVGVTFLIARSLADAPFDRTLEDRTMALAQQVTFENRRARLSLPKSAREILRADEDDEVYFQIVGVKGELLTGDASLPKPGLYDFPEPGIVKLRTETYRGDEIRVAYTYVATPVSENEDRPVLVQVGETQQKRNRLANEIIKGVILPQAIVLPIAFVLVFLGLGRGLAPLKVMQNRIRDRNPEDLSPINPRGVPQEVAPLIEAFNDLLFRLTKSVNAQKRFIADAAHQMKTPLAGLKMQAELASRLTDPKEQQKSLAQIASSSDRAARMISQLLALARTENLRNPAHLEPVDLIRLTRDSVSEWHEAAKKKSIDLGFDNANLPTALVKGQPILLREMLNNLVDNAIIYTPLGGVVTVSIKKAMRDGVACILLEVEDSGLGIGVAERELIFSRFYRVLGTAPVGSGLGLAIVKEIADQHQATIEVEDTYPGQRPPGAKMRVVFEAMF